jgi:hypothetical protein
MMIGTVTEQVSSRRTWRLGGGFIKYTSKSTLSYDGDTRCASLCHDDVCECAWHSGGAGVYDHKSTADANSSPCRGAFRVRRVTTASTEKGATDAELTTSKWGEPRVHESCAAV